MPLFIVSVFFWVFRTGKIWQLPKTRIHIASGSETDKGKKREIDAEENLRHVTVA